MSPLNLSGFGGARADVSDDAGLCVEQVDAFLEALMLLNPIGVYTSSGHEPCP